MNYKDIKEKIEKYSQEKNKAEGIKERLVKQLKDEFQVSLENVETLIDTENRQLEEYMKKRSILLKKLDSLADWDSI